MFVDMGSATAIPASRRNRRAGIPEREPCGTETRNLRAGTWLYAADKLDQKFSPSERYATGIRNGMGTCRSTPRAALYATQHGRDQLIQNWGKLYPDAKAATELPSEVLLQVKQGGDYGWPYCYYDNVQKKLVLGARVRRRRRQGAT